jgi:pimeloyl-ACP methyl ester carboxylesterase
MSGLTQRRVVANGIDLAILEAGSGPLALCLHGFPDSPHSFRQLLVDLAAADLHAVAPFMRGYAPTGLAPDGDYGLRALARLPATPMRCTRRSAATSVPC